MNLLQISLKDFRCFYGEVSLEFSEDLARNVTLIHAENGVGKTTLLNALLWCFYGETTAKFEKREDLVNYDAKAEGRDQAHVEVLFEHGGNRYRARRFATGDRSFSVMRIDSGSHSPLQNPDAFINTVIPKSMAGHFLFDGEHAEVFLGEDNHSSIRRAVQDILGCSLIETAIKDLDHISGAYRRQIPNTKASAQLQSQSERIETLEQQVQQAKSAKEQIQADIEVREQQVADIEAKLRNSAIAKTLQARRDRAESDLKRARGRAFEAQTEILRWMGENARHLVSKRLTDLGVGHLDLQETKGRLPSPYNEEFVQDLLEMRRCICGAELAPGSTEHAAVSSLLQKAANATLRSRIGKVKARLTHLTTGRDKAPGQLDAANKRLAAARDDISSAEQELDEVSNQLMGIDVKDIAEREAKRNDLRKEIAQMHRQVGEMDLRIQSAETEKSNAERDLRRLAEEDAGARVFSRRYALCEQLKGRLEVDLKAEERAARSVLRASITKILEDTSRKPLRLHMTEDYSVSLVNEAGTQLPKSSGENQLLGLAFTAALVEFAKIRQSAQDRRLLKGTVAPLVLDSPFGQLDESYRRTTAEYVPQMANQVILMLSKSQSAGSVMEVLRERIGAEYVLVRHNKAPQGDRPVEIHQIQGKDYQTAVFDSEFDGSAFERVA